MWDVTHMTRALPPISPWTKLYSQLAKVVREPQKPVRRPVWSSGIFCAKQEDAQCHPMQWLHCWLSSICTTTQGALPRTCKRLLAGKIAIALFVGRLRVDAAANRPIQNEPSMLLAMSV